MSKIAKATAFSFVSVFGLALNQVPVAAAVPADSSASESCILNIDTGQYRCFSTIDALVTDVTSQAVTDVTSTSQLRNEDTVEAVDAAALASTIVAVFWDGSDYTGASLLIEASSGCGTDLDWDHGWSILRSDWDDRFNSGQGYSQCQIKIWEGTNYYGANLGYFQERSDFGALNNQTESLRVR